MEKHIEGKWLLESLYDIGKDNFITERQSSFFLDKGDEVFITEVNGDTFEGKLYKSYLFYDDKERTTNERIIKPIKVEINKGAALGTIKTSLVGAYNLPNVLLGVALGKHFNVPDHKIKKALEDYKPSNSRSQLVKKGTNDIILDAYNANPSSMKAAIENFSKMEGSRKVLILGGMMELGSQSIEEHQQLIDLIKKYEWEKVVLVGGDFSRTNHDFLTFRDSTEAAEWFKKQQFQNSSILIKGSRSTAMEKVLE